MRLLGQWRDRCRRACEGVAGWRGGRSLASRAEHVRRTAAAPVAAGAIRQLSLVVLEACVH